MAHILLFHSILGCRDIERDLAREWEGVGHAVTLPDLFNGRRTDDYEEGFALFREIGPETVAERAEAAAADTPPEAVLAGVSMGAGRVGALWGARPRAAGALLIAGAAEWTGSMRPGLPVQAHIARPDPYDDEAYFEDWVQSNPGAELDLHRYDGVGHYFLDPALPDYGAEAAEAARKRMLAFLGTL